MPTKPISTREEDSAIPPLPTPPPAMSKQTMHMTGLLVDVYGLDELAPSARHVSCVWLHHPRTRDRANMADFAARCVGAWNAAEQSIGRQSSRGLIALAFDQRNHGSRIVHKPANAAWRQGNATHAQDMFGVIQGTVADQRVLLDAVQGYLFPSDERKIDQHLALGVSLGGHSVWQLMFAEPRVTAGIAVIGCPDFMYMLSDRAKKSRLATYSAADNGASFLGSRDFPPALVDACLQHDPKGIFFGVSEVPAADDLEGTFTKQRRDVLRERLAGKKLLLCSGGSDKLVPTACSEPFMRWLKEATGTRFRDEMIAVDDRIYEGVGHQFTKEMVDDAIRFVTEVVAGAGAGADGGKEEVRSSKI